MHFSGLPRLSSRGRGRLPQVVGDCVRFYNFR
jgi:hypothetical protein